MTASDLPARRWRPLPSVAPDSLPEAESALDGVDEGVWIEVIRKMDEVYSDLLQYEVALERKNAALEESQQFIVVGMVLTGRQVGELRRAYHALRQAHDDLKRTQPQLVQTETMASVGRLVAGVAHELNNPISFVLGNVLAIRRSAARLLDLFFTTKPVRQGTGLGLSISYGIVKRHGERLTAANRPEGGAIFTLSLPLAKA